MATAEAGEAGLATFDRLVPDLVITDLKMPDLDGIQVLERIKTASPATPVIMITGFGTIPTAVEAMKRGAEDYLTKPFDASTIRAVVKRVLLRCREGEPVRPARLVGVSKAMGEVQTLLEKVARTDVTVLIHGESGTGKELVARALHAAGPRRDRPFVAVHCAALPPTLLEAELFRIRGGRLHRRGPGPHGFCGPGAEDGTLFLDEVGDIPLPVQTKLLRLLQEREIQPLGSDTVLALRAQVTAATHRDLKTLIEQGEFREDLYYRLNVVPVHLPPLRDRPEDVPPLLDHFLERANRTLGRTLPGFHPDVLARLQVYPWPGNVRELANLVERLVAMKEEGEITMADLPEELLQTGRTGNPPFRFPAHLPFEEARRTFERDFFARLLEETGGNVSKAARQAGISRPNLYRRLKEVGLDPGAFKKGP